MNEKEWLNGKSPQRMLEFVRDKSSDRRLRLFVCGVLRTYLPLYDSELSRTALETSQRFADGLASAEELATCRRTAREAAKAGDVAAQFAVDAAFLNLDRAIRNVFGDLTTHATESRKVRLLHDLWGPRPFRNVIIDESWLTPTVIQLAQTIYDNQNFDQMPILADALEKVGCHHADILGHCRGSRLHVRGCWVLDLILGKT